MNQYNLLNSMVVGCTIVS